LPSISACEFKVSVQSDIQRSRTNVGGTQSIYLGGSIAVAAGQVAGVYTGNITATVSYN